MLLIIVLTRNCIVLIFFLYVIILFLLLMMLLTHVKSQYTLIYYCNAFIKELIIHDCVNFVLLKVTVIYPHHEKSLFLNQFKHLD